MDYSSESYTITLLQFTDTINPQSTVFLLVALLVLLFISFLLSGAEVALFSLQHKEINVLKTKQHPAARRIVSLLDERKAVYASLLLSSSIFNICIIILSNYLLSQVLHIGTADFVITWDMNVLIKIVVITFIIVFFGKILPKVWASQNTLRFAYTASSAVEALHLLLRQISLRLVSIADSISKTSGANESEAASMRELDDAIDIDNVETTVEEKNILKGIVKFSHITVKQIMRSRLDVNGVEYNTTFPDVIRKVEELHYSRLPVYKNNLDEVIGVLNTKDILPHLHERDFNWQSLIRTTLFIPETRLIKDLLKTFQTRRIHFAVVVDEFGGTSGIVTLEDILEEIIGDIHDEFDDEESSVKEINNNTYLADARVMLYDLCRAMRLPIDTFDEVKGDSESLGGLVLELAGRFPAVNDTVSCGDFQFTVTDTEKNRIRQVKVQVNRS